MRPRAAEKGRRSQRKRRRQDQSFVHQSLLFKKWLSIIQKTALGLDDAAV
jgi:hypothetical protein